MQRLMNAREIYFAKYFLDDIDISPWNINVVQMHVVLIIIMG